jgi:hypothetical protein
MLKSILFVLAWLENHSGTTSLVALVFAVLSALFKPPTWRRVVASILAGLVGFLFLPYDANDLMVWGLKATILGFVFICAFWWIVNRFHAWRSAENVLPGQPSGTFEAIVDSVTHFKGNSDVSVQLSSAQGTLTVTRTSATNK